MGLMAPAYIIAGIGVFVFVCSVIFGAAFGG